MTASDIYIIGREEHAKSLMNRLTAIGYRAICLGGDVTEIPPSAQTIVLRTKSCSHTATAVAFSWARADPLSHLLLYQNSTTRALTELRRMNIIPTVPSTQQFSDFIDAPPTTPPDAESPPMFTAFDTESAPTLPSAQPPTSDQTASPYSEKDFQTLLTLLPARTKYVSAADWAAAARPVLVELGLAAIAPTLAKSLLVAVGGKANNTYSIRILRGTVLRQKDLLPLSTYVPPQPLPQEASTPPQKEVGSNDPPVPLEELGALLKWLENWNRESISISLSGEVLVGPARPQQKLSVRYL